jgi:hypothetical protein
MGIFNNQSVNAQFLSAVQTGARLELADQIGRYIATWVRLWNIDPVTLQGPAAVDFPSIALVDRIAAYGPGLDKAFQSNSEWASFIESQANAWISQNGVPEAGDLMSFLLPHIVNGVFILPGIPTGYTLHWSTDGSATVTKN